MEERASDDVRDALRKQIVFEVVCIAPPPHCAVSSCCVVCRGKAAGQWDASGGGGEYLRPLAIRDVARRGLCPPPVTSTRSRPLQAIDDAWRSAVDGDNAGSVAWLSRCRANSRQRSRTNSTTSSRSRASSTASTSGSTCEVSSN